MITRLGLRLPPARRAVLRARALWVVVGSLVACQPQLPGPIECEKMVYEAIGRTPEQVEVSPLATRIADRLVFGCLTVPFDRVTVECVEQGRGFLRCTEELAQREPNRRRAVHQLGSDLNQLLPRERTPFFR